MSKKLFTEEEPAAFRADSNVEKVSSLSSRLIEAFQQETFRSYPAEKSIFESFREAGFAVSILGLSRMTRRISNIPEGSAFKKKEGETCA